LKKSNQKYSGCLHFLNSMKNSIIFLLLGIYLHGFSQKFTKENPGTPEQRAKIMTDTMQVRLKLNNIQTEKIHALNLKYAKISQKEVIETDASTFSKYWKGNEINNRKEKELNPLLTADQWKLYEEAV
jgi:hypothetical protein